MVSWMVGVCCPLVLEMFQSGRLQGGLGKAMNDPLLSLTSQIIRTMPQTEVDRNTAVLGRMNLLCYVLLKFNFLW